MPSRKTPDLRERQARAIFLREQRLDSVQWPIDPDIGIIPGQALLVLRSVRCGAFVEEIGVIGEGKEAVSKALRQPEHALVPGAQLDSNPFPAMWRRSPKNARDAIHRPPHPPHTL